MIVALKKTSLLAAALLAVLPAAGCGRAGAGEAPAGPTAESGQTVLTVSAAASLTDALRDIGKMYESGHPNIRLSLNFGGSGTLLRQIEEGAPADLFLSASGQDMDELIDRRLVVEEQEGDLLANELVVVVRSNGRAGASVRSLGDLADPAVKRVAIGIPESVPAGTYAQQALARAGLWDALKGKTVQAKDVRQVLQYVETGNADAGFVYRTDARASSGAEVAFAVDPALHAPIRYPAGVLKAGKHPRDAEALYRYLFTEDARKVFRRYGFSLVAE